MLSCKIRTNATHVVNQIRNRKIKYIINIISYVNGHGQAINSFKAFEILKNYFTYEIYSICVTKTFCIQTLSILSHTKHSMHMKRGKRKDTNCKPFE